MGLFLERKYWLQIQHYSLYLFANGGQCKKFFNPVLYTAKPDGAAAWVSQLQVKLLFPI